MRTRSRNAASGFSLVELMIALVLGLILTAGVISVYATSKKTYAVNNALGAVQEAGRFAMSFMAPVVRMAGFSGCAHSINPFNDVVGYSSGASFDLSKGVQGYEASGTGIGASLNLTTATPPSAANASLWAPALPTDLANQLGLGGSATGSAIAGSDILVVHEASNGGIGLSQPWQDSAGVFIPTADAPQLAIGEIVVVSDCKNAALFQITNMDLDTTSGKERVDHSGAGFIPGNITPNWKTPSFGQGASIMVFNTDAFYIGIGADKSPSLFEVTLGTNGALGSPQELVSGVENMQIVYGVDTDGDKVPNNFQTADTVDGGGNWGNVVSVRIALLTQSGNNSTEAAPATAIQYVLLGNSATDTTNGLTVTVPQDRRLRRTFAETISIRNLLP